MTTMTLIILAITAIYALSSLVLLYGTYRQHHSQNNQQPFVSVLLAARNEEKNISSCLQSLLQSHYPGDKFEIFVIDDRSIDGTRALAENFARQYSPVRVIPIQQRLAGMSGKTSALCQGIKHARGEIILMTDADCQAPPVWISQMVRYFTPEVGLVGGFTVLSQRDKQSSLFAKIQTLDWMYLLTIGAGAAGLGKPLSIIGNNFAFRRAAYEAVGGYEKIGFSIIEDFALMRAIDEQTRWRVIFPIDPQTTMISQPTQTWREFYEQRQRWAAGGKEAGWQAKLIMALAFLRHLAGLAAWFISVPLATIISAILIGVDFLMIHQTARQLRRKDLLRIFPLFELYYFFYSFLFAPAVLLPATVRWKGMRYRWSWQGKIKHVHEAGS